MIGGDYFSLGDPHKALEHYSKALELVRAISLRELEASLLGSIGSVYLSLSEYQKAEGFYNQALLLSRTITYPKREAFALRGMGEVYLSTGEPRKALECYAQALLLYRAMESRMEEAATLYGIARAKRELGDLTEARAQIEGALNIIESTRTKVMSQDLRSSFLASNQSYYELYIDVLMSLSQRHPAEGYAAAALLASERARARSLLEILMESRFDIRQGVDAALLQRERNLQQRINAKAERLTRLLGGKHTEQDVAEARKEIDSLLADYRQIQAQIRRRSPRYAALVQPQPLTLNEIQEQVLDDDSLLLEYSLGRDRSYLWAITSSQMKCYELPARDKIETAARRLYELLARGDRRELRTQLKIAAAELSRIVLNPVAAQLKGKRLLIVSDGTLQYIPFASLPEPQPSLADAKAAGNRQQGIEYGPALILQHEVLALPSASVLAILRQEFAGKSSASKAVAVLADPVLVSDDPRIKRPTIRAELHTSVNSQSSDISLIRSARESGVSFERLRYTRQEADTIVSLSKQGASLKAVDFDASKATAINPALGDYRIIHFATHGLINSRHPELSGLVLSLVDERGRPQDGFLRLHDVYNLKLAADLIVLSACQTALGKEVKGEGLIGLTRGFMYAGAARVVASLWDVKDEATAELMKRFYERVFRDRLKPSAALRAAQISMWKEERWRSPYYWAGFIFQGEWR
jgi:CHAT domain-containing protein